jgi:hypothetical protein
VKAKEDAVRELLRERGAAPHVVEAGAAGLIAGWQSFVAQVEAGYPMGLEEYRNDLDLRGLIAAAGLDSEVAEADERLRAMLIRTDVAVWSSDVAGAFWVRGFPSNAAGELRADLRAQVGI